MKIIIPQLLAGKIWRNDFLTVIFSILLLFSGLIILNRGECSFYQRQNCDKGDVPPGLHRGTRSCHLPVLPPSLLCPFSALLLKQNCL